MKKILSLIFISFLSISFASAQSVIDFSVDLYPQYPKEFEKVTLTLDSTHFDINTSKISWIVDGKVVYSGIGFKIYSIQTPKNGVTKNISIEVYTPNNYLLTKAFTLTPQALDILWEAPNTYVPPFYKGKALPAEESIIKVVAFPNFFINNKSINRDSVSFTWTLNDITRDSFSGYGKNSFTFKMDPLYEFSSVRLIASTADNFSSVEGSFSLKGFTPEILLYEKNPLLGILFSQAFTKTTALSSKETSFYAAPFSFSGKDDFLKSLRFSWNVGGSGVTNTIPNILTLRTPADSGKTSLSVFVSNPTKILQEASRTLSLIYTGQ